jgi:hypothetical protein
MGSCVTALDNEGWIQYYCEYAEAGQWEVLRMYDPMTVETYGRLPENRKPAFLIFMHAMWESGKLS